jgi:hypothetical protein
LDNDDDDDDDGSKEVGEPFVAVAVAVVVVEDNSKRSFAGCGITPPGNDAAKRIGSSLHSGHISDPFP